jgi:hypothetical protein
MQNSDNSTTPPNRQVARRGDGFDIGEESPKFGQSGNQSRMPQEQVINIIQNPSKLAEMLDLTEEQAKNVAAVIAAGGAGVIHKLLADHLGSEIAGAIGGFLGGYVAKKVVRKK